MTFHYNDPDNFIYNPEYFHHYCIWLLREHEGTKIQTISTKISNA